jgi:hypothetical protein
VSTKFGEGQDEELQLVGSACIDHGGLHFGTNGDGHAKIMIHENYAAGGDFTISAWVLKTPGNVWLPPHYFNMAANNGDISAPVVLHNELIYSHPNTVSADIDAAHSISSWSPEYEKDTVCRPDDMLFTAMRADIDIHDGSLLDWDRLGYKAQTPFFPYIRYVSAIKEGMSNNEGLWSDRRKPWIPDDPQFGDPQLLPSACTDFEELLGGIWNGPDDHSSAVSFAWDSEAFYVAVKVIDDHHQNPGTDELTDLLETNGKMAGVGWNDDAVNILFANAARDSIALLYDVGLEPSGVVRGWVEHGRGNPDVSISRDETTSVTVYEFAVPALALGLDVLQGGMSINVGVVVDEGDDDGDNQAGQRGWDGWGPYITIMGKTPESTGIVTLSESDLIDTVGGIQLSVARGEWLDAWQLSVSVSDTESSGVLPRKEWVHRLPLQRDEFPTWTQITIVATSGNIALLADNVVSSPTHQIGTSYTFRGIDLGREIFVGTPPGSASRGRTYDGFCMLRVYASALDSKTLRCDYESGRVLVQGGVLSESMPCEGGNPRAVGCTNIADQVATIDDGSCKVNAGLTSSENAELGSVSVGQAWQRVVLTKSYTRPVVLCTVSTHESSEPVLIRVRQVHQMRGVWQFDVRLEIKRCHILKPERQEEISYLVVETGISSDKRWQAGRVSVHEHNWHRVSFLDGGDSASYDQRKSEESTATKVIILQLQTDSYDNQSHWLRARLWQTDSIRGAFAFFVRIEGYRNWCENDQFYAEWFPGIEFAGSPIVTACESVPAWRWPGRGVPDSLAGLPARDGIMSQFSARWTGLLRFTNSEAIFTFSSAASGSSRIIFDGVVLLDRWGDPCAHCDSDPTVISPGYHHIVYEFSAGWSDEGYAQLSWEVQSGTGARLPSSFVSNASDVTAVETIGWIACETGTIYDESGTAKTFGFYFDAGTTAAPSTEEEIRIVFASKFFTGAPAIFGNSIDNPASVSKCLRLNSMNSTEATLLVQDGTCDHVDVGGPVKTMLISWLAVRSVGAILSVEVTKPVTPLVHVLVLLDISTSLRLPAYLGWRERSDPCNDDWRGIECRAVAGGVWQIVVIDLHHVDLAGLPLPLQLIGELTDLEELSMWNCDLVGLIDGVGLCKLKKLRVLALGQNNLHGILPTCMAELPLEYLWLGINHFHGPMAMKLSTFIGTVAHVDLGENHWAPLLPVERLALQDIAAPLGVRGEHGWDFSHKYVWAPENTAPEAVAENGVPVIYGSIAGQPQVLIDIPFKFPWRGGMATRARIGPTGLLDVDTDDEVDYVGVSDMRTWPEALQYCRTHYHDLASIHTAAQNTKAVKACRSARTDKDNADLGFCWIGLHADIAKPDGRFRWSDASRTSVGIDEGSVLADEILDDPSLPPSRTYSGPFSPEMPGASWAPGRPYYNQAVVPLDFVAIIDSAAQTVAETLYAGVETTAPAGAWTDSSHHPDSMGQFGNTYYADMSGNLLVDQLITITTDSAIPFICERHPSRSSQAIDGTTTTDSLIMKGAGIAPNLVSERTTNGTGSGHNVSILLAMGPAGLNVTWDSTQSDGITGKRHNEIVSTSITPSGIVSVRGHGNSSWMWTHVTKSVADMLAIEIPQDNLATTRSITAAYIVQDPCSSLWRGLACSRSPWPVSDGATARLTAFDMSGKSLRGQLSDSIGVLSQLSSLKLHDNFLSGTITSAIGKLTVLKELDLTNNQFRLHEDRNALVSLFQLPQLETLGLTLTSEHEDLPNSIITPAPPLNCRVGVPCQFQLSTRTPDGVSLSHGGLRVEIEKAYEAVGTNVDAWSIWVMQHDAGQVCLGGNGAPLANLDQGSNYLVALTSSSVVSGHMIDFVGNISSHTTECYSPRHGKNGTGYEIRSIRAGESYHCDQTYGWEDPIPEFVKGGAFIATANGDTHSDGDDTDWLCFSLEIPATVYLLYDTRIIEAGTLPEWVEKSGFEPLLRPPSKCLDELNGTYTCAFPSEWMTRAEHFSFHVTADGQRVEPIRRIVDATTGAVSEV